MLQKTLKTLTRNSRRKSDVSNAPRPVCCPGLSGSSLPATISF